jgi:hypothetical protein
VQGQGNKQGRVTGGRDQPGRPEQRKVALPEQGKIGESGAHALTLRYASNASDDCGAAFDASQPTGYAGVVADEPR